MYNECWIILAGCTIISILECLMAEGPDFGHVTAWEVIRQPGSLSTLTSLSESAADSDLSCQGPGQRLS